MRPVYSVTELTQLLKQHIQSSEVFTATAVSGEISNLSRPASGHLYFTLKDDRARLRVVMFASKARYLRFQPRDGMRVIAHGGLGVYESTGDYQLYAEAVLPDGVGELYLAYEQLRARLEGEGLFARERKRSLPAFPKRVALVTSGTGAAVRDMIITLRRRYPLGHVLVVPVPVQGDDAARQIAEAIALVCERQLADVMIVGRGGGSFEELFAFSTEVVARAIAQASIPVVAAVGHETDVSIADFVADVRAPTPTAAAELVSPDLREIGNTLGQMERFLRASITRRIQEERLRLTHLQASRPLRDPLWWLGGRSERVDRAERALQTALQAALHRGLRVLAGFERRLITRNPSVRLKSAQGRLDDYERRLRTACQARLARSRTDLARHMAQLEMLSPLAVLRRGYTLVTQAETGKLATSIDVVQPGDFIKVQMSDGWLDCQVWGVYPKEAGTEG